jgi:hypothetical protein
LPARRSLPATKADLADAVREIKIWLIGTLLAVAGFAIVVAKL